MSFKTYPSSAALEKHIDAFMTALSKAEIEKAFTLCPALTWKKPELADPKDKKFFERFLGHALFEAIESQEVIEGLEFDEGDPASWLGFITPPSKVKFKDVNLSAPEQGEGEVLFNVHLRREVTDITARFRLLERGGGWILAFSSFEVM